MFNRNVGSFPTKKAILREWEYIQQRQITGLANLTSQPDPVFNVSDWFKFSLNLSDRLRKCFMFHGFFRLDMTWTLFLDLQLGCYKVILWENSLLEKSINLSRNRLFHKSSLVYLILTAGIRGSCWTKITINGRCLMPQSHPASPISLKN